MFSLASIQLFFLSLAVSLVVLGGAFAIMYYLNRVADRNER